MKSLIGKKINSQDISHQVLSTSALGNDTIPVNTNAPLVSQAPTQTDDIVPVRKIIRSREEFIGETVEGYTRVQCLMPGRYVMVGVPSITGYTFEDEVDDRTALVRDVDLPDMLAKTMKQGCCGSKSEEKKIFQLYE
jgi:hypothetical protein